MSEATQCEECKAIAEELRTAARESPVDPKRSEELRANADALRKLMAGTGKGVDELLARFPFRSQRLGPLKMPQYPELSPRLREVCRRMQEHEARTGHDAIAVLRQLFRK
jgi:hypothetical protein